MKGEGWERCGKGNPSSSIHTITCMQLETWDTVMVNPIHEGLFTINNNAK